MIRDVVQRGSAMLEIPCALVTDLHAIQPVVDDLIDTIQHLKTTYNFRRGIGLAAPQIAVASRVTVIEFDGQTHVLINPEIVTRSDRKQPIREGCLSFFAYRANVPRYESVTVKALDREGNSYAIQAHGDLAMLLQHELDHLDGILYVDHLPNGEQDLIKSSEV